MRAKTSKKSPNATDAHVGARVRMRRAELGLSQEKLANELGLTFQQVQKYEKGTNRIGASRLQHISDILNVPISYFFEGVPSGGGKAPALPERSSSDEVVRFAATAEGLALAGAFMRIDDARVRRRVVQLVESMAQD